MTIYLLRLNAHLWNILIISGSPFPWFSHNCRKWIICLEKYYIIDSLFSYLLLDIEFLDHPQIPQKKANGGETGHGRIESIEPRRMGAHSYSLIIPAYNEENRIRPFLYDISRSLTLKLIERISVLEKFNFLKLMKNVSILLILLLYKMGEGYVDFLLSIREIGNNFVGSISARLGIIRTGVYYSMVEHFSLYIIGN